MASGIRNMMMALVYKIRKCLVVNEKAGRGCGDRFFQLFCRTAAIPLQDFYKFVGQVWCVGNKMNAVAL